jgi:hypothetical protein
MVKKIPVEIRGEANANALGSPITPLTKRATSHPDVLQEPFLGRRTRNRAGVIVKGSYSRNLTIARAAGEIAISIHGERTAFKVAVSPPV